jgi:uncharacterized protein (UPF0335 family)
MAREREGSNGGVDGETIRKYLGQIDKADDKLVKLKVEHMSACKGPRGQIRGVMKEARESGINMPALRAIIAAHRSERKIDQRIDELEADDRADYDAMLEALGAFGDTPLGEAALRKAKPKGGDDNVSKLDTLRA